MPPPSEDTARWAKHARDVVRAVGARLQEAVSTPGGREGVEVQGGGLARAALHADAGGRAAGRAARARFVIGDDGYLRDLDEETVRSGRGWRGE